MSDTTTGYHVRCATCGIGAPLAYYRDAEFECDELHVGHDAGIVEFR